MNKHYIRLAFTTAITLIAAFAITTAHAASCISGGDLYYTHISGSTYKITLALYADCGASGRSQFSTLPSITPKICIYDGGTEVDNIMLSVESPSAGTEIPCACIGAITACTSTTTTVVGIKKFVYSGTYTLPHVSSVWRFIYNGYNGTSTSKRMVSVTNMSDGIMQLVDTLNNTYNNTSPVLTVNPKPYFCLDSASTYNSSPVDPDGDALKILLTSAIIGNGTSTCSSSATPANYYGTYSPEVPLVTQTGTFSHNNITGEMTFRAISMQRSIVTYNFQEWRGGVLVGTSQREMSVLVVICGGPCVTSTPTLLKPTPSPTILPNPATDFLEINNPDMVYTNCVIFNTLGQVLIQQKLQSPQQQISIHQLPSGVYAITLKGSNEQITKQFVKGL